MGENSLTLHYSLAEHVELPVGAWCEFQNIRYTLMRPESFKKKHNRYFEYTVIMEADEAKAKIWKFRNTVDGRLKFQLTAKPHEHLQMFVDNMNRRDSGWKVGDCIEGTEVLISYDHAFCYDALAQMASELKTEFEIEGKTVSLHKVEYNKSNPLDLAYGRGKGFKPDIGRSNYGDNSPMEILYVQGGSDNIDRSKYPVNETLRTASNGCLLLPVQQSISYDGEHFDDEEGFNVDSARTYVVDDMGLSIRRTDKELTSFAEDSLDCSEIYPKRVGTISDVVVVDASNNFYDIVDSSIPSTLNYDDCLIEGEIMTVIFQSGMLSGKEFEVKYVHEAKGGKAARRFEIVPQEIDGQTMPNDTLAPAVGDTYAIFNCTLPDAYICDNATKTGAEWDMFRSAVRYMFDNEEMQFSFTGELDGLWAKQDWVNIGGKIRLGGYIRFYDEHFQQDGVLVRITGIKDYINNPHSPELTLSNSTVTGSFSTTMREIKSEEVVVDDNHRAALQFTKRRFRDAKETIKMLEEAMLDNFTNSISPLTVQTMMMLVGDESLQFRFVKSLTDLTVAEDTVYWDNDKLQLTVGASFIQHMTIGINEISISHDDSEYKVWALPSYVSAIIDDETKKFYLYAKVSETAQTGEFLLSETAIGMEDVSGCYHLLVGLLNSEYDGARSFVPLYGFTEVLPGRITTDRIVSTDGTTYFDLDRGQIGGRIVFSDHSSTEAGETILEGGKLNTRLIDTDRLVARHIEASDGHIADFTIQGKEIVGRDGTIVLQNDLLTSLSALLSGEEDTYSIPIGNGATASVEKASDGQSNILTVDTITATTDVPLSDYTTHAGVLRFAVDFQVDTQLPEMGIIIGESPTATCEVLQVEASGQETVIDRFSLLAGRNNHLTFINSPASYRIRTSYGATFTVDWLERPEGGTQFPVLEVSASVSIVGYEGADTLSYQANTPSTRIGTDGLFSFWSPRQYLYFSKDEGFSLRSGITLTSPSGEYSLTINDQGISIKGEAGTDASNNTVSFTMAGTRVNISTGEKLSVAFGKIARWLADLKTVAFTGKYSDLDGRPTSLPANGGNADTVDGKHASDFLPTSAKGAASGVASLDESGRVPAAQLPSYVDDVLEYATVSAFPAQGEAGKIYVATQTNLTYRWSGTGYVEISPSLALGGTSSTAFPGDRGVTLETKMSNILDGGLKVAKATSADTALEANHASAADNAIHADYADSASSATNAGDAIRAQQAVKATQDSEGNNISSTYLKKSGGVMTGTLVQKKGNCSIHTDVASYRMPDNHTGWVRIDFGLLGAELLGVIDLIVYGKGGISIDFSGYTYVSSSNPTANNWYAPKYGIRGSLDAPMPIVRFAKDNTTGRRYIMIGGDSFKWGPYGFISLSKIVLGSLGNTTGDLSVSIEAVSGNYADLGLTNASVSNPSVNVEVERARKATLAETLGEDAYTSSQVVGSKGALSTAEDEFPKDLSSIKTPGIYAITSRNTGQPSGYNYGVLCVFTAMKEGNNRTVQMFTSSKSRDGGLVSRSFVRYQFDNLLNWAFTPWVELVDTYDLPDVYVDTVPTSPKDGDILITTTD